MSSFLMVATGREEVEGGLAPRGDAGYYRHDREEIQKLCRQIETRDLGLDTRAIPDMWAQVIKLQQSLVSLQTQKEHGERGPALLRLREQWRGLLALVVLRKEMNLQGQMRFTPAISDGDRGAFSRVARTLLPDDLTDIHIGWKSLHVITYAGTTIGCTSPLTFVCPSATVPTVGKAALSIPGCSWFAKGVFQDPIATAEATLLQVLLAWAARAVDLLAPTQRNGTRGKATAWADYLNAVRSPVLRAELDAFVQDLKRRIASSPSKSAFQVKDEELGEEIDTSFETQGEVQEALRHLVSSPKGFTTEHIDSSPFLLRPAPDAKAQRKILLIHDELKRHPNFDSGKIELLRGISLTRALEQYSGGTHDQVNGVSVAPGAVYSADEIFCRKILLATGEGAFPGAYGFKTAELKKKASTLAGLWPVLPLEADFTDQFTPEYLSKNVEFSGSEDELKVTLTVYLGPTRTAVKFSRTYKDEDILRESRLPELNVWPEYDENELKGWKTWYAYYNDLSVSGIVLAPLAGYCTDPQGRTSNEPVHSKITDTEDKKKKIEVHRCSSFPGMFECSFDDREQGLVRVGIVLARPQQRKDSKVSGDWEVSIDFGTTGTAVYCRHDGNIDPLRLEPHVLAVTKVESVPEAYKFFLPSRDDAPAGFLSIFKQFTAEQLNSAGGPVKPSDVTPYLGGHMSFLEYANLEEVRALEAQGVYADMKWGSSDEQARGKAFLMQLCLLTALQAKVGGAKSIRWVFSYPLSFSQERLDHFEAIWHNCVEFALSLSGIDPTDENNKFRRRDESTCAAMFAQDRHRANIQGGSLILDIGGGSTDISIWANPGGLEARCIRNTSVKFAGRDILQRPLSHNRELLEHFVAGVTQNMSTNKDRETLFFTQVDLLFKRHADELLNLLATKHGEKTVNDFVGILSVGMRGVFYYAGLVLKYLASQDRLKIDVPDVFVCGNGGKILHWLNFGRFKRGSNAEKKLIDALRAGGGFPVGSGEVAQVTLSGGPKTEAAYGMLVNPGEELQMIDRQAKEIIAGEAYFLGNQSFDPLSAIEFDRTGDRAYVVSDNLPTINSFLESSDQRRLPPRTQKDIVSGTNGRLAEIAKRRRERKPNERQFQAELEQPVFILALNELIQQAARDWAKGSDPWWM